MEKLELNNWNKALVSRIADDMISENAFADCKNVDLSDKYVPMSIKGKTKYNELELVIGKPIKGIFIYHNKDVGDIIVAACGGKLWYKLLITGVWQKYQINGNDVEFYDDANVEFVQYNNCLYMVNGTYPVITNAGYETALMLQIDKYKVNCFTRDIKYAWTYNGEILYTANSTPVSEDILYADIFNNRPNGNPTVSSYNSSANTLTASNGNTYTRYTSGDVDNRSFPRGLKYLCVHQERIFGAVSNDDANGLYWSNPYDPVNWLPVYGLNYDSVGHDDGEQITGIASFNLIYIYIFKNHNVYRYLTSGDIDQWVSNRVDTNYGCVSHRTIKLFEGALFYLSQGGVVKFDGNSVMLIDDAIRNKIINVNVASGGILERRYQKVSEWDQGTSEQNVLADSTGLFPLQAVTTDLSKNVESYGSFIKLTNSYIKRAVKDEYIYEDVMQQSTGITLLAGMSGLDYKISRLIFVSGLLDMTRPATINFKFNVWVSSIANNMAANIRPYLRARLVNWYNGNNTFNIIATSDDKYICDPISSTNGRYFEFSFNNVNLPEQIYYAVIEIFLEERSQVSSSLYCSVNAAVLQSGSSVERKNDNGTITYTYNNNVKNKLLLLRTDDDISYMSKEIEVYNGNPVSATKFENLRLQSYYSADSAKIKLTIANYDISGTAWDNIADKYEYTVNQGTASGAVYDYIALNNITFKKYVRYKIEFLSGQFELYNLRLSVPDSAVYISDKISIAANNPLSWKKAIVSSSGNINVYMRAASNADELNNAQWIQIRNNNTISASMPLFRWIQFKIDFNSLTAAEKVSAVGCFFDLVNEIVSPCAAVWINKYILNMPAQLEGDGNSVEYCYDKDGYWVLKDNEKNFCYFAGVNGLYAGSAVDGIIHKKYDGYTNDGVPYECMFTTKRFAMTDFENLFRQMKIRFKSNVAVTVSVKTDDNDWKDYVLEPQSSLYELLKTMTGICRGQYIQFKFSWMANESTEIHKFTLMWNVLRELNRG